MVDLQIIEEATRQTVQCGHRILQAHRFAENDVQHIRRLVLWADLSENSRVIDMGCGIGEVARLWRFIQPRINFCLVNISPYQLELAPNDMPKHCCDMINVPESNNSFDAAICLFSIGHVDRVKAFKEMARLVKDNGVVFIYDMVRIKGDNKLMNELSYRVDGREDMENSAKEAGLYLDLYVEPVDQGWYGPSAMGGDFERYFSDVKPAIWRFKRHNNYVQ